MKIKRVMKTEKQRAFWAHLDKIAEEARKLPDWMKAGIDINPWQFETYPPKDERED